MKLFAAAVVMLSVLASEAAFAQAGGPSGPESLQTRSSQDAQRIKVTRSGEHSPTQAPADHFTGSASVDRFLTENGPSHTSGASVAFEPGARTAWHSHPLGQTLIVTAGAGWVQQWGSQVQEIRQGDIVWIPPGIKHWHGATASTSMTHIGIQESLDGKAVEWMEQVSDQQYRNPRSISEGVAGGVKEVSAAPKLMRDFDPKLAELTNNVLYGDIWERPGLSKRDRSLITVAAMIALNRPEQLRSHLQRARDNGVTKDEVVEMITHLAFYAGWPNAVTALAVAKETFQ
ncbi:MAG TPA: carboxymuconolactone decarboxylase family protein [Gemmata sp.]|jgi:4-carboxymuconolactone decarboxylase|nr:carboxymuconolactone decarboxylase family protein [Gemmata sp.]